MASAPVDVFVFHYASSEACGSAIYVVEFGESDQSPEVRALLQAVEDEYAKNRDDGTFICGEYEISAEHGPEKCELLVAAKEIYEADDEVRRKRAKGDDPAPHRSFNHRLFGKLISYDGVDAIVNRSTRVRGALRWED